MSHYHDRASGPPRVVDGPGCTPARVVMAAGGEPFRGTLRAALGCREGVPMPAEFWVQTSLGGTATCGQHLADVVRLGFRGDPSNAVVVDRSPAPSLPCRVYRDLPEDAERRTMPFEGDDLNDNPSAWGG